MAAVPLILYLLYRRRKRDVDWGATYILRRTLKREAKKSLWKQIAIIAVRTLAFIALPLVFLRPYLDWQPPAGGAFAAAPPSTHRLVLLDLSPSMGATHGSGGRLEAALGLCRKILEATRHPGRIDILPLDGSQEPIVHEQRPVSDIEIEQILGMLELSTVPADFEQGLRVALQQFRASHYQHKELILLSDFSAVDLKHGGRFAGTVQALDKIGAKVFCLSYENRVADNFALLDMTPGMDLLLSGQPTIFYVRVGYYDSRPAAQTWLSIRNSSGELLIEQALSLAPGDKTFQVPLSLAGGEQTLTAALSDDDLACDNRLERSYHVSDRLQLALVQNLDLREGFDNPSTWIKTAFAPQKAGGAETRSIFQLEHVREQAMLKGHDHLVKQTLNNTAQPEQYRTIVDAVVTSQASADFFKDKDGVILVDVDTVTEELEQALYNYVVRGGTLLLAPGPNADPDTFNQTLRRLLPAQLAPPAVEQIDPDIYQHAILEFAGNPILRELEASDHGNIGNTRFYNGYQIADNSMADKADVLFVLSDNAPLLLHRRIGRGSALLWTAGLGGEWHSMVVHPVYPVLVARLFNLAASQRRFALNLEPGAPIVRKTDSQTARISLPDGDEQTIRSVAVGSSRFVRFDHTQAPGTYTLYPYQGNREILFRYHVPQDRRESDYRPLGGQSRSELEQLIHSPLYHREADLVHAVGATYEGSSLASLAALALLLLLVLEVGLIRKWFT